MRWKRYTRPKVGDNLYKVEVEKSKKMVVKWILDPQSTLFG